MKTKKKAQVKMMETIIVLLVFVFLLGMIMIFYARFQITELNKAAIELEEQRAILLINKVSSMPELRCSMSFGSASEINCLDTYKLLAFTQDLGKFEKEFTGLSSAKITKYYPVPEAGNDKECSNAIDDLTNYPHNCAYWDLYESNKETRIVFDTFVTLCTPKKADFECVIGKLEVGVPER
ncbi:MAG: hypothetical protein KJ767_01080 [Nanoarchaeota archaeon]|nr:hypothetical protein [Nanoarchaeota archaeon]